MSEIRHILLTGGGTLGPVTPLLALAAEWRRRNPGVKITWVGTPSGPERALVEAARIPFRALSVPKFDRTRIWKLPVVPLLFVVSCVKAWRMLREVRPDVIVTAGAFVSVPFAYVGKALRIPTWVHQLDIVPGLANKLMAPLATRISVTWEENVQSFPREKTLVVGGMIRPFLRQGDAVTAREQYGLSAGRPTVFVVGGGTGASSINEMMGIIGADVLRHANVIHATGKGKMLTVLEEFGDGYVAREFFGDGVADVYALADVVVCRAGMGTIMELVALGKSSIILPLPGHQEENARALERRESALVLWRVTPQTLLQAILRLVEKPESRQALAQQVRKVFPVNGDERLVHEVERVLGNGHDG